MQRQWFAFLKRERTKNADLVGVSASLIILFCAGLPIASAEDYLHLPAVDLVLPQKPQVGDVLVIPLEAEGDQVRLPEGAEKKEPEGWQLINGKIALLQGGKVAIPSLIVMDAQKQPVRRTNPVEVEVISTVDQKDPKAQAPYDDLPPMSLAFPWVFFVLICLLVAAGIGLLVFALQRWSKNRKSKMGKYEPKIPEVIKTEDQIVMELLQKLQTEKIYLQARHKEHAFAISDGIKFFLGKRYECDAEESTTSELLFLLKENFYLPEKDLDGLRKLFSGLDQTKFTDRVPSPEECEQWIALARDLVLRLRKPGGLHAV